MTNITEINSVIRPHEVALINAINLSIDEIAVGNMTLAEILGCLDLVAKDIYQQNAID